MLYPQWNVHCFKEVILPGDYFALDFLWELIQSWIYMFQCATKRWRSVRPILMFYFLFVKDLTNFISLADYSLREQILQKTVNKLTSWTITTGLTFSSSKSTVVYFFRIRHSPHLINIYLNNKQTDSLDT